MEGALDDGIDHAGLQAFDLSLVGDVFDILLDLVEFGLDGAEVIFPWTSKILHLLDFLRYERLFSAISSNQMIQHQFRVSIVLEVLFILCIHILSQVLAAVPIRRKKLLFLNIQGQELMPSVM